MNVNGNRDAQRGKGNSEELRFVDLCAGLGGFHQALIQAQRESAARSEPPTRAWTFKCVMAADIDSRLREVYPRNFPELAEVYPTLFPPEKCAETKGLEDIYDQDRKLIRIHGNLADLVDVERDALRCWPGSNLPIVPEHDLLCAGFPCQPFSKSGAQLGFADLNGTVFRMIAVIIAKRRPRFVFLENVGNFERHDNGNTWETVRKVLTNLGYSVRATTTVGGKDNGLGLLSPHHLGLPQHRERFFIVAQREEEAGSFLDSQYPFPLSFRSNPQPSIQSVMLDRRSEDALRRVIAKTEEIASRDELRAAQVSTERIRCVNHWRDLLKRIESHDRRRATDKIGPLPSFPIWGYELDPWNEYPIACNPGLLEGHPGSLQHYRRKLVGVLSSEIGDYGPRDRAFLCKSNPTNVDIRAWVETWPRYARSRDAWPLWKKKFIEQNRAWSRLLWSRLDKNWLRRWLDELYLMPPSHQKLEWNCQGEDPDLWRHILQFRPSGLRVKRFRHIPALVAMTTTQIPIVPSAGGAAPPARHLLTSEALELQGFPRTWAIPAAKEAVFQAIGNAVHVGLVAAIARTWLFEEDGPYDAAGRRLVSDSPEVEPGYLGPFEGRISGSGMQQRGWSARHKEAYHGRG